MGKMDGKAYGTVHKAKDDTVIPEDEWVLFQVKDDAFAATLPTYLAKCAELGADAEQIAAVRRLIARVTVWRQNNPERCKVPDAKGERLLDD